MRYGKTFKEVNSQLFRDIRKHAFLLVQHFLVSANKTALIVHFKTYQYILSLGRQGLEKHRYWNVFRGRAICIRRRESICE